MPVVNENSTTNLKTGGVKTPSTNGGIVSKNILVHATDRQIKEWEQEVKDLENMLKSDRVSENPKISDKVEFMKEINKKKKLIKNHSPKPLTGEEKNKWYAKAKEIEKVLQEHMPRKSAHGMKYPKGYDHDFERAVKQEIAYMTNPKLKRLQLAYKHIMRRLDPQDPTVTNIERLRK